MSANNLLQIMGVLKSFSSRENKLSSVNIHDKLPYIDKKTVTTTLKQLFCEFYPNSSTDLAKQNYFNVILHCYRKGRRDNPLEGEYVEIKDPTKVPEKVPLFYWMENRLTDSMIDLLLASVVSNQYIPVDKTFELVSALNLSKNARDSIKPEDKYIALLQADDKNRMKKQAKTEKNNAKQRNNDIYKEIDKEESDDTVLGYVNLLMEAIRKRKRVSFQYGTYNEDKELVPKRVDSSICNPYAVMSINGYYYVIVTHENEKNSEISPDERKTYTYRIDRIYNMKLVDERRSARPKALQRYFKNDTFDAIKYRSEHPAMMGGTSVTAILLCKKRIFNNVLDMFGFQVKVIETVIIDYTDGNESASINDAEKKSEEYYKIRLSASEMGIISFCKSYCEECIVLSCIENPELPAIVKEKIGNASKLWDELEKYNK